MSFVATHQLSFQPAIYESHITALSAANCGAERCTNRAADHAAHTCAVYTTHEAAQCGAQQ